MRFSLISLIVFAFQTAGEEGRKDQIGVEKSVCQRDYSTTRGEFPDGDGSAEKPYVICNVSQLQKIRSNQKAHYVLGRNIDASSIHFTPIEKFSGELNGNGFVVSNLYVKGLPDDPHARRKKSSLRSVGLFRKISSGARIKNLGLEDMTFYMKGGRDIFVGGLAGEIEVDGEVSIVITNSYVSGSMTLAGGNNVILGLGGLIGRISVGKHITFLFNEKGPVHIKQSYVNGSFAFPDKSNMVFRRGELIGVVQMTGGSKLEITDSYVETNTVFRGDFEQNMEIGGLIGRVELENSRFEIKDCSIRGRMLFLSTNSTVSFLGANTRENVTNMGGLFGSVFLVDDSYLEIADSYIEADTSFYVENARPSMGALTGMIFSYSSSDFGVRNYTVRGKVDFSSINGKAPLMGGLAGGAYIEEKSSLTVESQIEAPMTFSVRNNSEPRIGGLIGSLLSTTRGYTGVTKSNVNGPMILFADDNSGLVTGGLISELSIKEGYMIAVNSNVNGAITFPGNKFEFNPSVIVSGFLGVVTNKAAEKDEVVKGRVEIANSYVGKENDKYPIVNLSYKGELCSYYSKGSREWEYIHKSRKRYGFIMEGKMRSDRCLLPVVLVVESDHL